MAYRWHHLALRGRIASQLVGDEPTRHPALPFQELAKESFGGFPITARLDEDVDDVTVLVDRTPELLPPPLDRDEDLVQMPRIAQATLSALQSTSVLRPELDAPQTDGFIGNGDAPLGEHLFYVSEAHAESMVEPDRVADDLDWKSVSAVARRVGSHRLSVPGAVSI